MSAKDILRLDSSEEREALINDIINRLAELSSPNGLNESPNGYPTKDNYNKLIDGVVRIYCTHSEPNFGMPWQRTKQDFSTSSGFIIESTSRQILTNAHAVEYGSLIQVKKRQSEKKYVASVLAIGHECDLAILAVEDDEFWEGMEALTFGSIPDLQADVSVVGYPVGGDSISISSGVVSRIEMQEYSQASAQLLAIQIDAAINPGNSGGPVVDSDTYEVIGVAFQSLSEDDVENIGYVVPINVIDHFLEDVQKSGRYSGVCEVGLKMQSMDNDRLRSHYKMGKGDTGVLVIDMATLAPAAAVLRKNDVILAVNGIKIANDGTIPFEFEDSKISGSHDTDTSSDPDPLEDRTHSHSPSFKERVALSYYFSQLFPGDVVELQILRDGKRKTVEIAMWIPQRLIPRNILRNNCIDKENNKGTGANGSILGGVPSYLLIGGLVLVALSREYLEDEFRVDHMGSFDHWSDEYKLLSKVNRYQEEEGEEILLLSQVLAHGCNIGYETCKNFVLEKVNGISVKSLKHLRSLLLQWEQSSDADAPKGATKGADDKLVFEFSTPAGYMMVLDREEAMGAQAQLMKEHFIPNECSPDLL